MSLAGDLRRKVAPEKASDAKFIAGLYGFTFGFVAFCFMAAGSLNSIPPNVWWGIPLGITIFILDIWVARIVFSLVSWLVETTCLIYYFKRRGNTNGTRNKSR